MSLTPQFSPGYLDRGCRLRSVRLWRRMLTARLSKAAEHRVLIPLLVGALVALLVACTALGGSAEEILGALPAIFIAVALALGRYPGEQVIQRLAARRIRRRPKAPTAILPLRSRLVVVARRLADLAGSRPLRGPPPLVIPITR